MYMNWQRSADLLDPENAVFATLLITGVIQCINIHCKALKSTDNKAEMKGRTEQHAMVFSCIAFK